VSDEVHVTASRRRNYVKAAFGGSDQDLLSHCLNQLRVGEKRPPLKRRKRQ